MEWHRSWCFALVALFTVIYVQASPQSSFHFAEHFHKLCFVLNEREQESTRWDLYDATSKYDTPTDWHRPATGSQGERRTAGVHELQELSQAKGIGSGVASYSSS